MTSETLKAMQPSYQQLTESDLHLSNGHQSPSPSQNPMLMVSKRFSFTQFVAKGLALTQALGGLVCLAVASLYLTNDGALSSIGVPFWCGLYFAVSGIVGLVGVISYRRGLIVASIMMCIHSIIIFAPIMIFSGVAGIYADKNGCSFNCTLQVAWDCRFTCDLAVNPEWADYMQNYAGGRADLGILCLGVVQLILALFSLIISARAVCECLGVVDDFSFQTVTQYTRYNNHKLNIVVDKKSSTAKSLLPATINGQARRPAVSVVRL